MGAIKKVWITDHDAELVALSIESANVKDKHMRVKIFEAAFPEVPSKRNPLRHVVHVSLLDEEDLKQILIGICKYLKYDINFEE